MDAQTVGLIGTFAGLGVGVVALAATLLVQGHRREQKAHAATGGVAVAGGQHAEGSVVTGAGAVVVHRGDTGLTIVAQSGAIVYVNTAATNTKTMRKASELDRSAEADQTGR
jgi:hypothetical protein